MKTIKLTQGKFATVDDEDFEKVNQYKWSLINYGSGYAKANTKRDGKRYVISMHRFIMGLLVGDIRQVDHINHNGLDNRKINLRICSFDENRRNRLAKKNKLSILKGVYWVESKKKWRARITFNHKIFNLGYFVDKIEAAKAYNKAAKKYFGEFAYLNKV